MRVRSCHVLEVDNPKIINVEADLSLRKLSY